MSVNQIQVSKAVALGDSASVINAPASAVRRDSTVSDAHTTLTQAVAFAQQAQQQGGAFALLHLVEVG